MGIISVGEERNFALEVYGEDSKCFDHTESMWEERSCSQVCETFNNFLKILNIYERFFNLHCTLCSGAAVAALGLRVLQLRVRGQQTSHHCTQQHLHLLLRRPRTKGIYRQNKCSDNNFTFPFQIRLRPDADEWLHTGSVVCPPCPELCAAKFREAGTQCAPPTKPPLSHVYPQHVLTCGATSHVSSLLTGLVFVLFTAVRHYV